MNIKYFSFQKRYLKSLNHSYKMEARSCCFYITKSGVHFPRTPISGFSRIFQNILFNGFFIFETVNTNGSSAPPATEHGKEKVITQLTSCKKCQTYRNLNCIGSKSRKPGDKKQRTVHFCEEREVYLIPRRKKKSKCCSIASECGNLIYRLLVESCSSCFTCKCSSVNEDRQEEEEIGLRIRKDSFARF